MVQHHNTNKYYYEYRALLTLQKLFPNEYKLLSHSDRPDLFDSVNCLGIEVVRAVDSHSEKDSAFFQKYLRNKKIDIATIEDIKRFEATGNEILVAEQEFWKCGDIIIGYSLDAEWQDSNRIKKAISKKIEQIDRYANSIDNLSLYVFTDTFRTYESHDIAEILLYTQKHQSERNRQFVNLYIDDCGWFYLCNLHTGTITFYDTTGMIHSVCERALSLAMGGTEQWKD